MAESSALGHILLTIFSTSCDIDREIIKVLDDIKITRKDFMMSVFLKHGILVKNTDSWTSWVGAGHSIFASLLGDT